MPPPPPPNPHPASAELVKARKAKKAASAALIVSLGEISCAQRHEEVCEAEGDEDEDGGVGQVEDGAVEH